MPGEASTVVFGGVMRCPADTDTDPIEAVARLILSGELDFESDESNPTEESNPPTIPTSTEATIPSPPPKPRKKDPRRDGFIMPCGHGSWLNLDDEQCAGCIAKRNPDGLTLLEVGKILGVTRERVRQIESIAIRKLRKARVTLALK